MELLTNLLVALATLALTLLAEWGVRNWKRARDREVVKLRLSQAADGTWRVRNVSGKAMWGLVCYVSAPSNRGQSRAFDFDGTVPRKLASGDELDLGTLSPGDGFDAAWTLKKKLRAGGVHTTETLIVDGVTEYALVERRITYGKGYGPH